MSEDLSECGTRTAIPKGKGNLHQPLVAAAPRKAFLFYRSR
jgi:hypothetical protein